MKKEEVGYNFLVCLGKICLCLGGKIVIDWLIVNGDFNKDKKVFEVVCNMGIIVI